MPSHLLSKTASLIIEYAVLDVNKHSESPVCIGKRLINIVVTEKGFVYVKVQ